MSKIFSLALVASMLGHLQGQSYPIDLFDEPYEEFEYSQGWDLASFPKGEVHLLGIDGEEMDSTEALNNLILDNSLEKIDILYIKNYDDNLLEELREVLYFYFPHFYTSPKGIFIASQNPIDPKSCVLDNEFNKNYRASITASQKGDSFSNEEIQFEVNNKEIELNEKIPGELIKISTQKNMSTSNLLEWHKRISNIFEQSIQADIYTKNDSDNENECGGSIRYHLDNDNGLSVDVEDKVTIDENGKITNDFTIKGKLEF